ncbi:MAG: isoprenyl transferase [bacterium]|nr:isoprenyl transferase [bacterium]
MSTETTGLTVPGHIAIIMDGNGRWAQERGQFRLFGHKAGVQAVREVVETARSLGVRYLTLYAFSTENWRRPENEVSGLMALLQSYLKAELKTMLRNDIRLCCLGEVQQLPVEVGQVLEKTMAKTAHCSAMVLNLALSYGGRNELLRVARNLARECEQGTLHWADIDETLFTGRLYSAGQPDPDLLIRTGGEHRLSNFLLWQLSYAELYFTDTKWPDFRCQHLVAAIEAYNQRQRRFGKTGDQVQQPEPL